MFSVYAYKAKTWSSKDKYLLQEAIRFYGTFGYISSKYVEIWDKAIKYKIIVKEK